MIFTKNCHNNVSDRERNGSFMQMLFIVPRRQKQAPFDKKKGCYDIEKKASS